MSRSKFYSFRYQILKNLISSLTNSVTVVSHKYSYLLNQFYHNNAFVPLIKEGYENGWPSYPVVSGIQARSDLVSQFNILAMPFGENFEGAWGLSTESVLNDEMTLHNQINILALPFEENFEGWTSYQSQSLGSNQAILHNQFSLFVLPFEENFEGSWPSL